MTIKEVSERFNLTSDTIRYYEKVGLLKPIQRDKNGIRDFTEEDLERIQFVKCMRAANITIENLQKYLEYYDAGDEMLEARLAILNEQKQSLEKKMEAMQEALDRLNYKIELHTRKV